MDGRPLPAHHEPEPKASRPPKNFHRQHPLPAHGAQPLHCAFDFLHTRTACFRCEGPHEPDGGGNHGGGDDAHDDEAGEEAHIKIMQQPRPVGYGVGTQVEDRADQANHGTHSDGDDVIGRIADAVLPGGGGSVHAPSPPLRPRMRQCTRCKAAECAAATVLYVLGGGAQAVAASCSRRGACSPVRCSVRS